MSAYIKTSGTWKQVNGIYIKDGGSWKLVKRAWIKVSGVWKLFHAAVDLLAGSYNTSTLSPTDAVCQYRITSGGVEQADEGSGFSTVNTWLLGGSASDYDVRYSPTGDTGDMLGDAINTWLNLGSTQLWAIEDTSGVGGSKSVSGPLEIRAAGGGSAIASATLTLTAEESN